MEKLTKTIYQTWYTKVLPEPIQKSIDNMLNLNPEFEYHLYDDDDMIKFIHDNYPGEISEAFDTIKIGAMKADLWRYLVLYKFGGVYLDIDSEIYSDLSTLIVDDCAVITRENNPNLFVQWMLIFPPNHELLKICIDKCVWNIMNIKDDVAKLTGPFVYSDSIREYLDDNNVYNKTDDEINRTSIEKKLKIFSHDYNGYASYYHADRHLLYVNKTYWRDEQNNY
jgi:hypothetical protein